MDGTMCGNGLLGTLRAQGRGDRTDRPAPAVRKMPPPVPPPCDARLERARPPGWARPS
jgi:hypothetical protein